MHSRVDQSLDNGHSSLGELLLGVSTGSVGDIDSVVDVDVVGKGDVFDLDASLVSMAVLAFSLCDKETICIPFPDNHFAPCRLDPNNDLCHPNIPCTSFPNAEPFAVYHTKTLDSLVRVPFSEELDGALVGDLLHVGGKSESHFVERASFSSVAEKERVNDGLARVC